MKKLTLLLLCIVATLTSCSSDDDAAPAITEAKLIGKWQWTASTENGEAVELDECDLKDTFEFKSNGDLINTYYPSTATTINGQTTVTCSDEALSDNYKWSLSGDQLTTIFNAADVEENSKIIELTDTTLKIEYSGEEAGEKFVDVDTYKKI